MSEVKKGSFKWNSIKTKLLIEKATAKGITVDDKDVESHLSKLAKVEALKKELGL